MRKTSIAIAILLTVAIMAKAETYHNKWVMVGTAGGRAASVQMSNYAVITPAAVGEASDGRYTNKVPFFQALDPFLKFAGEGEILPLRFELSQNYPNPFNSTTVIEYALPVSSRVTLDVHNILGQKVETCVDGFQQPGYYSFLWYAPDKASGIYFYRLTAADFTQTKRMMLIK